MTRKPAIVSPVMRFIGVADAARSVLFYRDVLGFDIRGEADAIEAVYGPARIRFGSEDVAPDDWQTRPTGSAQLFFETDDIDGMHEAIRGRGGSPTSIEKANGIKLQMFEVRDPDGHTLWFGQSYAEPVEPRQKEAMLQTIMPSLPLDDVPAGVAYYRDVLGFSVNYAQDNIGVMDRDKVRVLLIARTERHKGIGSAYVYVENADALYAELVGKGAKVQGEPVSQPWGLREFTVVDPEGNEITLGQPFE